MGQKVARATHGTPPSLAEIRSAERTVSRFPFGCGLPIGVGLGGEGRVDGGVGFVICVGC